MTAAAPLSCPVCGTAAVPGARFCFHCGTPLERDDTAEVGAERRVVTVLFGDLSDFTSWAEELDPERVGVVTDELLAALTKAVADVGGHVDKLTGDGIMAVFGAPTAHEDDAVRAVRAAAAMQSAVRRLVAEESGGGRQLGLRVGLNTGEVLAGMQAGVAYTVVGDTVNTASRLSDAAGVGSVYAGRDTALTTMAAASWRALPPLRLKGKREPVPAYELVGLRSTSSYRAGLGEEAPFVGRDAELGLLIGRLLDAIDRGEPASVVMTGEAGVGKTRLAAEIARFAGELPASRVLWGRCAPYGEGRDLGPLVEWVRTACGLSDGDLADQADPAVAVATVRRVVGRLEHPAYSGQSAAGLADRLLGLLGLAEEDQPVPRETATPGAPAPHAPTLEAVLALLRGLATTGPLLLVVDDMQWAGDLLFDALAALAGRVTGPVVWLCIGRGDLLLPPGRADWWRALPHPELLGVLPLERATSERLLRAYLGGAEIDPAVQATLLDRAEGNAFFLGELLHLLVDRGLLRRVGEQWALTGALPDDVLPAGVQAVLAARIDGLDATAKGVLRDAAVIGSRFLADAAAAVSGLPRERVDAALATLVDRGILRVAEAVPGGPPGWYHFDHALARDVAYAGVPKAERARRHAAVAGWAVAGLPASPGEVDAFVGSHAERAVRLAEEMRLPAADPAWSVRGPGAAALIRLAHEAVARDDSVAALDLYTRGLALGAGGLPDDLAVPARTGRAAALVALNELAEAETELAPGLASPEVGVRSAALVVLGDLRRKQGDERGATEALVSALAGAAEAGLDAVTGEALRQLGLIDYLAGRLAAADDRFGQALRLAERVDDARGAGWALQHLAWNATTRGDYAAAEARLRQAAEVFGRLDDTGGLSWCAGTEAFVRLLQGRLHEARELAGSLLPLAEQLGERWGAGACLTIDAMAAAELGDVTTAATEAARARAAFVEVSDGWGQAMALVAAGMAARGSGDTDAAVTFLEEAVALAERSTYAVVGSLALAVLGYCHLDRGDPDAAERAAHGARAAIADLQLPPQATIGAEVLLAQALRARGELTAALALLDAVDAARGEPSLLFPLRQALAHRAGALLDAGRPGEALAVVRRALDVPAEDVRSQVVAQRVLGAVLLATGDGEGACAALEKALAIATSTDQRSEIPATERALAAARGTLSARGG